MMRINGGSHQRHLEATPRARRTVRLGDVGARAGRPGPQPPSRVKGRASGLVWLGLALGLLLCATLSAGVARAATRTYTGNAVFGRNESGGCDRGAPDYGADFNNPHNWDSSACSDDGAVPGPGDTAIIPAGFLGGNGIQATAPVNFDTLDVTYSYVNFGLGATINHVISEPNAGAIGFAGATTLGTVDNSYGLGFTGDATIDTLNMHAGVINGGGTLHVTRALNWDDGYSYDTLALGPNCTSTLTGPASATGGDLTSNGLINQGTMIWNGPGTFGFGSFNNSGTVLLQADGTFLNSLGAGINTGTIEKTTGVGTTLLLNVRLDNSGILENQASTGKLEITNVGALLDGTQIQGPGVVEWDMDNNAGGVPLASGTITVSGTLKLGPDASDTTAGGFALRYADGTNITGNGTINWLKGSFVGDGDTGSNLTFGSNLTINLSTSASKQLYPEGSKTVTNNGVFNWMTDDIHGGTVSVQGSFVNNGTFNQQSNGTFLNGTFTNNGTLNTFPGIPSTDNSILSMRGTLNNNGKVNVGGAGTVGAFSVDNFDQAAGGVLNLDVGGILSGQFDQLLGNASANLGGTLNVSLTNGYKPTPGAEFTIIKALGGGAGISDKFATINGPFSALYNLPQDVTLTVLTTPTISGFTPTAALAGATVTISGTGFTGATSVAFNGKSATNFTVVSDTQIKATVPAGATGGSISITTPGGTVSSGSAFTVLVPPTITGFTPSNGPVGTVVTVTGTGLSGATVAFGAKPAPLDTLLSTDTKLVFTVPVGAVTGNFKITTPGGSVTSKTNFTVTTGDGISGHVFAKDGKTPLKGVRVFLIKNGDLAALLGSAASPDIVSATTDATGAYHLPGQAAGTYIITPLVPGTAFTSSHGTAPVSLAISGATTLDFTATITDSSGPTVTLATPLAKDYATLPTATGTITDSGSGPLAVVVGLYRLQNGSIVGIYDWRAQTFVAANSQDPGVFKTVPTSGPNWTLTLPALAPSSYRLSVIGVNKAFKAGTNGSATPVSITRDFSLSGGGSATDSIAPTVSLTRVNGLALATVPPGTSALTVSSLLRVEGTATDNKGGTGVGKVNLYLFRNLKTVISSVAYSAEFWNGTSWVSLTVSPLSKLSSLPTLSTTLGTTTAGVTSWSRATGLPQDNGNYNLAAVAYDKAGNQSDYLSIFIGARTITVKAAPKSVSVALSSASAQASRSIITLKFLGVLDADGASDAAHYSVTINGAPVTVESAGYNAAAHTLTLALPEGALRGGDAVTVQGRGLNVTLAAR